MPIHFPSSVLFLAHAASEFNATIDQARFLRFEVELAETRVIAITRVLALRATIRHAVAEAAAYEVPFEVCVQALAHANVEGVAHFELTCTSLRVAGREFPYTPEADAGLDWESVFDWHGPHAQDKRLALAVVAQLVETAIVFSDSSRGGSCHIVAPTADRSEFRISCETDQLTFLGLALAGVGYSELAQLEPAPTLPTQTFDFRLN